MSSLVRPWCFEFRSTATTKKFLFGLSIALILLRAEFPSSHNLVICVLETAMDLLCKHKPVCMAIY